MNGRGLVNRLLGFVSCFVELFTDQRAPLIERCYEINTQSGTKHAVLRTEPFVGFVVDEPVPKRYKLNGVWVYPQNDPQYFHFDPSVQGSFLVIKLHNVNASPWEQWVQVIYANKEDVQHKGWLPRWEFIQLVLPRHQTYLSGDGKT